MLGDRGQDRRGRAQIRTAQRHYRFAAAVRAHLARNKMSTCEVATKIDLGVDQLCRMLVGTVPMPMDVMEAVARFFGHKTSFKVTPLAETEDDAY